MVGFGMLYEPWFVSVNDSGGLEVQWRDRNEGQWLTITDGSKIKPNSAVGVVAIDKNGTYVPLTDANAAYVHFKVRTNDGKPWIAWLDLVNWTGKLQWSQL
jgi:hypothetical protein